MSTLPLLSVAPVVKTVAAPVVKTVAAPVLKTVAAPLFHHTYAAAPVVTYHHQPLTYTHTVSAGNLVHTVHHAPVVGAYAGLPVAVAAQPVAADEGVAEA